MNNLTVFGGDRQSFGEKSSSYTLATTANGIELYIHQRDGEVFASQRMLGRLVGKADTTIMRWMKAKQTAAQITPKMAEVLTPQGIRTAALYNENAIYQAFAKWKPELLVQCAKAGVRVYLHGLAGYRYGLNQQCDHQLLIESQQRIIDLQDEVMSLKDRLKVLSQRRVLRAKQQEARKREYVDFAPYASKVKECVEGKDMVTVNWVLQYLELDINRTAQNWLAEQLKALSWRKGRRCSINGRQLYPWYPPLNEASQSL